MKKETKSIIQMVMCAVLWSTAGIFMKKIPWSGISLASLRAFVAMIFFIVYMQIFKIKYILNRKTVISACIASATYICFCIANKLTTAANVIVLQYTAPLFILIFSAIFLGKKIERRDLIAVLITVMGIFLCFADGIDGGKMLGNCLSVLSGAFFGGMMVVMGENSFEERFSTTLNAQIITFLVGLPSVIISQPEFSMQSVLLIVILGVFQIGLAFVFYIHAASNCTALSCCLISLLEPILNPVWVMIFDGEKPGILAVVGGIIVLITVTVWSITNPKKDVEVES